MLAGIRSRMWLIKKWEGNWWLLISAYFPQQSLYFSPLPHGQGSSGFVVFFFPPHPHDNAIRLLLKTSEFADINIFVL